MHISLSACTCMYVCLSLCLSVTVAARRTVILWLSIYMSLSVSVSVCVCLSVCLYVYNMYVCVTQWQYVGPLFHGSVYTCLCVCVCVSTCVCLSVCLSVCMCDTVTARRTVISWLCIASCSTQLCRRPTRSPCFSTFSSKVSRLIRWKNVFRSSCYSRCRIVIVIVTFV